jgi:glycosyltransferase involved in cell wall biosynthesis
MSLSGPETLFILPPREDFSPAAAGAISLVVRRLCSVTPRAAVLGTPRASIFSGIDYVPVRGAAAVFRAVARLRPAVLEVHQQPRLAMALAAVFPKIRVMLFVHNDPLTMRGLRTRVGRRLALRLLHRVVFVSEFLRDRFMTGVAGGGAEVLPNPLTLSELPARNGGAKIMLFVGRMTIDKAPDVFVAACALALPKMPGWTARMIGGDRFGPTSPETVFVAGIRAAAKAAGVAFEGPQPHAEVCRAMAGADIVVVPSRWAEPFGLTALEAMANGAALITTGQGGLREVAGDAAVYVPVGDVAATAAAMLRLSQGAESFVAAGLARAKLFDTAVIGARLAALR